MKLELLALPVNQGDAFLLRDEDRAYLFDGGLSEYQAVNHLVRMKGKTLDVVICSHNDSDHTKGIIGVLGSDDMKVSEVWIPDLWPAFIVNASRRDAPFFDAAISDALADWKLRDYWIGRGAPSNGVIEDVPRVSEHEDETHMRLLHQSLERIAERFRPGQENAEGPFLVDDLEGQLRWNLRRRMHSAREPQCNVEWRLALSSLSRLRLGQVSKEDVALARRVVKSADNIRRIVELAVSKAQRIRFFAYQPDGGQGDTAVTGTRFTPLNSVEIKTFMRRQVSLSRLLYLSESNQQSLVFKYGCNDGPEVLFNSDSDLPFVPKSNLICLAENSIATAPHHGSRSNASAYAKVAKKDDVTWVRSGSIRGQIPCMDFRQLPRRYCTICDRRTTRLQPVVLRWSGKDWRRVAGAHLCPCK